MAFGFGFNKQKVLSAAEKCVQQGKLQNAISEYEKVLKADPKDLTVMNTVGDLYSRLGEQDKAADCFKSVGDAYAAQGFTVKAIAMYKKLSKLKASMECVLRLAELYTQQGLFNDARAQYLQVAEEFLKTGQLDQAVRIFQKTLEMDPDNVPMRTKLAEVYVRLGKKEEAWKILTAAAETLRGKGQLAAADEILQKMLKLEPGNSYALVLRGRSAVEAGDFKAAIECLSKVADLDSNPDGLRILFNAYLRSKRLQDAATLAGKLASVHDDNSAIVEYSDALIQAQQYRDALQVYEQYSDRLLRNDPEKFLEILRSVIRHVQDDTQALETVLGLFQKAGENTHQTEIYELLAHGYVQSGELERAREYYLKLTQLEPANQMHARNYQQVLEKQGTSTTQHLITAEEGAVLIEELEATAPFIDQRYDDETALAVRAALTDAELFISYNMAAKALAPLIGALPTAPRDLRLNQKLAALHTRAERFAEAGVCCRTLESIYHDTGHAEEASRYGELASKYEERSASGSTAGSVPHGETLAVGATAPPSDATLEFEISAPVAESADESVPEVRALDIPAVAKVTTAPSGLFFHGAPPQSPVTVSSDPLDFLAPAPAEAAAEPVAEIDLFSEWEQALPGDNLPVQKESVPEITQAESKPVEVAMPAPTIPNLDESIEEVRFYLGQGMTEQAEAVLGRLEALLLGAPELAVLRLGIESAKQITPAAEPEPEIAAVENPATEDKAHDALANAQPWPSERPVLQEIVSELEASLGGDFLGETESAHVSGDIPETVSAHAPAEFRSGTLDDFVSDLEASLGTDFIPPHVDAVAETATAAHEEPAVRAAAAAAGPSAQSQPVPLSQHLPIQPLPAQSSPVATAFGPTAGVDLSEMFGELKHELEEDVASADEDPETHYNLGVAFREMGLLDEAIGELQKVCQAVDRGHAFPQLMQTYTWLAQCFLDKGVPEVAIRWYEKALTLPSLDQETRTALHYELASSFESAGNNPAALSNFLQVYGSNIDYRDVGERIKALRT
jgi:pilus assembly protein FimV